MLQFPAAVDRRQRRAQNLLHALSVVELHAGDVVKAGDAGGRSPGTCPLQLQLREPRAGGFSCVKVSAAVGACTPTTPTARKSIAHAVRCHSGETGTHGRARARTSTHTRKQKTLTHL